MTTSIAEDLDELGQRLAYHEFLNQPGSKPLSFEQFLEQGQAKPKRYVGCWSEVGNSEWAGFASGTYATPLEAMEAAGKQAWCCRGGVQVWACESSEAA